MSRTPRQPNSLTFMNASTRITVYFSDGIATSFKCQGQQIYIPWFLSSYPYDKTEKTGTIPDNITFEQMKDQIKKSGLGSGKSKKNRSKKNRRSRRR